MSMNVCNVVLSAGLFSNFTETDEYILPWFSILNYFELYSYVAFSFCRRMSRSINSKKLSVEKHLVFPLKNGFIYETEICARIYNRYRAFSFCQNYLNTLGMARLQSLYIRVERYWEIFEFSNLKLFTIFASIARG